MRIKNYYFWIVAIANIAIDMASKRAIVNSLQIERTSIPIIPNIFHFTYIRNYGAAFSMLEGQAWLGWLSLIVSAILIAIGIFRNFNNIWEQVGLGAILAGAAGNGIDRLFFGGSVVDFIDLRIINFAIFNWADISINVGIICLLIHSFLDRPHRSNLR
jgi:signal peptidase II